MDRHPDDRSLNFAGDVDESGSPLPMTVDVLRARAAKWPQSDQTPEGVAEHLARSRQLFIDGYYTYENFTDAATRSLQAVEAALRVRFGAGDRITFARLIDRAHDEGLVDDDAHEILHLGRKIRNNHVHATRQVVWPPVIAANAIRTSHLLVATIFGQKKCS
jgi:hypothetical protein